MGQQTNTNERGSQPPQGGIRDMVLRLTAYVGEVQDMDLARKMTVLCNEILAAAQVPVNGDKGPLPARQFVLDQTCPRRMNETGPWERTVNIDGWYTLPNGDRVCSFCGSLHPEDLEKVLDARIAGDGNVHIEPCDKRYKIYIHREGIRNAAEGAINFYMQHLTGMEEQRAAMILTKIGDAIRLSYPEL